MIHGLDTGFLVAAEVTEHGEHTGARATLARLLAAGDLIAIAPQVLAEFIHIVTDPRRFRQPLDSPGCDVPAGRYPIAPHDQPSGLPGVRRLHLHATRGQNHAFVSVMRMPLVASP
jgi:hypothetical protein